MSSDFRARVTSTERSTDAWLLSQKDSESALKNDRLEGHWCSTGIVQRNDQPPRNDQSQRCVTFVSENTPFGNGETDRTAIDLCLVEQNMRYFRDPRQFSRSACDPATHKFQAGGCKGGGASDIHLTKYHVND